MSKPRVLDLFCGAGGCAVGYARAGFEVALGVDIEPQPRYPFPFHQGGALEFLRGVKAGDYDLIHASPPCQGYSRMRHLPWLKGKTWPMLIGPVRSMLVEIGIPWVIENVEDAPLKGVTLCGTMFGLKVYRHRRFESSEHLMQLSHATHRRVIGHGRNLNNRSIGENPDGWVSIGRSRTQKAGLPVVRDTSKGTLNCALADPDLVTVAGHQTPTQIAGAAMGIDWMRRDELCQAIPPAYTEWLGRQLLTP